MFIKSRPVRNNRTTCFCAFCNFWEGECGLKLHNPSMVEFDEKARGKCTKTGNPRYSRDAACLNFEFSSYAGKYVK